MITAEKISALKASDHIGLISNIFNLYREREALRATQIASLLDIDRRTATVRLRILLNNGLVRWTRHGYRKTQALSEYLAQMN